MAEISVAAAVGEGFRLIRRRPLTVLGWGLVNVAALGVVFAVVAPVYVATFGAIVEAARSGAAPPDPLTMQAQMIRMQGVGYLVDLVSLCLSAVVYCAVFRAVLHPEHSRFGYLRIGAPELYLAVLLLAGTVVLGLGLVIAMIPFAIVVGVLVATHMVAAAVIVGIVGVIGMIVGLVYLILRLSFVGPMMVDDGKFHLGDAWSLTKGKVGGLFLISLVLFALLIAAELVLGVLMVALGVGALGVVAGGLAAVPSLFQLPSQMLMARLAPILAVAALIWIPFIGAFIAVGGAPWARAYRDVRPATDVAEAFA